MADFESTDDVLSIVQTLMNEKDKRIDELIKTIAILERQVQLLMGATQKQSTSKTLDNPHVKLNLSSKQDMEAMMRMRNTGKVDSKKLASILHSMRS